MGDPKVFISSTGLDLGEYRDATMDVCRQLDLLVVAMEDFEAMGAGATEGSLAKLDGAEVYVGIFAHRYGYIEDGYVARWGSRGRGIIPPVTDSPTSQASPVPPSEAVERIPTLLREVFRHEVFRPFQEHVCREVARGEHALLVMPTGAGKSLCYQLPGIARGGTTLVVSPLIALMEDQVAKLQELGLAAERIHSGRDRLASRGVCRDYLDGRLDFLFIAPERLSVPGFPDMLAKRKPCLIAVDEAHCISHWGHDFRPDYRMLGQHIPKLLPAPVIALTATATPPVQDDIAAQLGMSEAQRFIHGFRRDNIAVEVVEAKPSTRRAIVRNVLDDAGRRPAIVYSPTRRESDELGEELSALFPAAGYHAGMPGPDRDRIQAAFLSGELEVIVATIAFGMGIDKPDIRTVIHTALPGSLEGYYQEIGRAGRDGEPSRAVLLWSWADRRTHEFFHGKSYPEPELLERLYRALPEDPVPLEAVRAKVALEEEVFGRALEQLWIHDGARVFQEGGVEVAARGGEGWKSPYRMQKDHKMAQLEGITRFAQGHGCRMLAMVNHFGDREDSGEPCGGCDVCAPDEVLATRFRSPTLEEQTAADRALGVLKERDSLSTGQLFKRCADGGVVTLDRRDFEEVLGALARAGLVDVSEDSFEKDGRVIHYQRAELTPRGWSAPFDATKALRLPQPPEAPKRSRTRKKGSQAKGSGQAARQVSLVEDEESREMVAALKKWRLGEARRQRIPAFRVLTDKALYGIAETCPRSERTLLQIRGIGPGIAKRYGQAILEIVGRTQ